ncbi:MAG: preprotein translocase subunit SecG [Thermodesulfovibrionales bacterium]|nr:preprotein translocase subunit SecG [Thermodesulfovibrionales bacterium]
MITLLTIIHILACIFLIFIVLIQSSKGAEVGAAFGGSSQTIFGSRGAATFLSKVTAVIATLFMITSLVLSIAASKGTSVVKETTKPPAQTLPQEPLKVPPTVPPPDKK